MGQTNKTFSPAVIELKQYSCVMFREPIKKRFGRREEREERTLVLSYSLFAGESLLPCALLVGGKE